MFGKIFHAFGQLSLALCFVLLAVNVVRAQIPVSPDPNITDLIATESATESAIASESAAATIAAQERIQERRDNDITETAGRQKDELVALLEATPVGPLTWYNVLRHSIRGAVAQGVPANTLVLVLLFPVITAIIAISRHVIGLRGFGIYIPAVLSVAFVSTGIIPGVILFLLVLGAAMVSRVIIRRFRLQYLPRTALLMWGVSVAIFLFLILTGLFGLDMFYSLNIFSILIVMLLTENFMETQLLSSQSEALQLTGETLLIAMICSLLVGSVPLQRAVILNPELTLIAVFVVNVIVGRYAGLRLLEYIRFRSLLQSS